MNIIYIFLVAALFFVTTGCSVLPYLGLGRFSETRSRIKTLEAMIRQGDPKDLGGLEGRQIHLLRRTVLDLGESAIPTLEKALDDPKPAIRDFSLEGLFLIGGEKARDVLKKAHEKTKDEKTKLFLCLSMASTGTPDDVDFLMETLASGDDRNSMAASAALLSLTVLKPEKMIEAVQPDAKAGAGMDPIFRELFLLSLDLGGAGTPQMKSAGPEDRVILTLFEFGIPGTGQSPVFLEEKKERTWKKENRSWSYFQDSNPEIYRSGELLTSYNPPYIEFETYVNRDNTRALVRAGVIFGKLSGAGYSFVLKQVKGKWKVTGMMLDWMS
ncbi:MAG: HEAT repeat domain-containing protein [Desulfobacteraceae bacterium]|nr:HEAT repeat domain-containing protein [Desulfobacteraceae bacterium]